VRVSECVRILFCRRHQNASLLYPHPKIGSKPVGWREF
jgi:hypothetical protein